MDSFRPLSKKLIFGNDEGLYAILQDYRLSGCNFNVEERDAKGPHYETLAICRTLATARRRTAIVVRLVDAHDLPEGICAAATSPADAPRRPRKPPVTCAEHHSQSRSKLDNCGS
jgi:hypothetical protein